MPEIYPIGLRAPLVNGYGVVDNSRTQSNDVEIGPPRVELLTSSGPSFAGVTWNFTRLDFQLFEAWHHLTLLDGSKSFTMSLLVGKGYVPMELFFMKGTYKSSYQAKRIKVSANLLIVDKPFDDQATLTALLAQYNDGDLFADLTVSAEMTGTLTP